MSTNPDGYGQAAVTTNDTQTLINKVLIDPIVKVNGATVSLGVGAGDALVANPLSQFAATTSAQLKGVISDETGSGALVFANGPVLVAPVLGTPASVALNNATGLPVSTGISGLGAGVAGFLATPSSANLATAVTDETGSGPLVFGTSPTIATPTIASLVNANHTHLNAAGGGTLTTAAIANASFVSVKDYGAIGNGVADDSAAFASAIAAIVAGSHSIPGVTTDPAGSVYVELPPGTYLITSNKGFLDSTGMSALMFGVKFRGAGKFITNIVFKPSVAGNLMDFDYFMGVQFEGISFYAATAGCTLAFVNAAHFSQRFEFKQCSFDSWKYVARLQGTDNNSEWLFDACNNRSMEAAGAWLFIGASSTVDQFLNFWWTHCTHWSTSAPIIDAAKGGHFHIARCDFSGWGAALVAVGKLVYLRGASHSSGVTSFTMRDCRIEGMTAFAGLVYGEWGLESNVLFDHVDMSSQFGAVTYGAETIYIKTAAHGASYKFRDCTLAGGITVSTGDNDFSYQHEIVVEGGVWGQKQRPSDVVTYETSRVTFGTNANPLVRFEGVRPFHGSYTDANSATGASVWDATIGWNGALMHRAAERTVRVGSQYGMPYSTLVSTICLPVGALITKIEAKSPAGTSAEGDGGTWTVTDGNALTIATLTVSSALSAGFNIGAVTPTTSAAGGVLTIPILCSTTNKSKIIVTPTNVANANLFGAILITGMW